MKIIFLLLSFIALPVLSQERTDKEMRDCALQKLQGLYGVKRASSRNASSFYPVLESKSYVVYSDSCLGYAIVTKNRNRSPIIAYSDKPFSANIPPDMQWVLNEIEYNIMHGESRSTGNDISTGIASSVGPLITSEWDQNVPYNMYTPTYLSKAQMLHYPTGCIATAMAQLMYYYKSPEKGTGGSSYYVDGKLLPVIVDFSKTTYEWNNMLPIYTDGNYTDSQASAVATLMYHCGAAVEMTYDMKGSGAFLNMGCSALRKKFGYGESFYYLRRFFNNQEWLDMIYTSLSEDKPILYGGNDEKNGGHAFVLDGYDIDGLVSVNWGWSGTNDGFFDISLLNPGKYSFKNNHEIVIVNGPNTPVTNKSSWGLGFDLIVEKSDTETIAVSCEGFYNLDPELFIGVCGIIAEKDGIKYTLLSQQTNSKGTLFANGIKVKDLKVSVNDLPDGEYEIFIASKADKEMEWQRMRSHETVKNCVVLSKSNSDFILSSEHSTNSILNKSIVFLDSPVRYFDLQGREVSNDVRGLVIMKQGNVVKKVIR